MKSHVRSCAALAAPAILFVTTAGISDAQVAPPTQGQTSLEVPADEVLLDLAVQDKRNRPVLDLQSGQISVTDNGTPVTLTGLRLVNGKQQDEPLITLLFDRPAIGSPQKKSEDDWMGGPESSEHEAERRLRDTAAKFLKPFPAAGFQFAVMDVWGRLQLQQGFTSDRKAVTQAVSMAAQPGQYGVKVTTNPVEDRMAQIAKTGQDASGAAASAKERVLARSMYTALETSSRISANQHMSVSLACLLALVQAQQSLPGRKAVVYFTSGSDTGGSSSGKGRSDSQAKDALRAIAGAANRAGVNIYVVRMSELDASKQMGEMLRAYSALSLGSADLKPTPATATSSGISGYQVAVAGQFADKSAFRSISAREGAVTSAQDGLGALAKGTGGNSLNAAENISSPVKDLIRDLETYYEASYVPPGGNEDGSFHATEVKALRSGLKVRTRTGYLALPRNAGITEQPQPFELPLMALLKRTELPGEVNYRATVLRMGHGEQGNVSLLAVEAPVEGLEIHEDTSTHLASAHVSILADIKDSTGTVIERFSEDIARRWAAGNGTSARPAAISFERPFTAPAGAYVLETAILDSNSGKAAANRQTFEIAAVGALPELSQPVLVRAMEPAEGESDQPDPLAYGDHRVEPNLYGELPSGAHEVSVFLLAHTDPQSQEPATVKLEVLREGAPLGGAPLTSTLQSGEFHTVLNNFSIKSASDGKYQVKATLTQGGKSATAMGDFTLAGNEASGAGAGASEAPLMGDPAELAAAAQAADRPAAEELDRVLAEARKNAIDYGDSLPNLICQQTTSRFEDLRGDGNWKHRDTLVELLTYVDHEESRTLVGKEENNATKRPDQANDQGMVSAGEFGQALGGVFRPESKAEFKWVETGTLRGETVEVFDYKIDRASSTFSLHAPSGFATVGYHGRIYVDRATRGVRSVTLITDEAPKDFPIRKAAVRVDYEYVAINDHDYLLPVSAQVVVGQGKQTLERNDLEFSNFRRFGSTLRIVDDGAGKTQ